jgi:hypothetical protein
MRILCLFALLFLLFNCSPPSVSYERIIENNSSYDIWVINPAPIDCEVISEIGFQDSILVLSNTRRVIESFRENSVAVRHYADCPFLCLQTLDSRISNHDSLSLTASLQATNSNWQYTVLEPGDYGSCECELTITDADIN